MNEILPQSGNTFGVPEGALLRPLAKVQGLPAGALLRILEGKPAKQGLGTGEQGTVPRGTPIGATEPKTGRPVLQESPRAEVNQAAATAEHPAVSRQLSAISRSVPGAKLVGARPEKDEDRLEEKIDEEGQSPKTVRDYSGFRISVDTPEAHHQVAGALRKQFEVPDEQDEFDQGSRETGFHGHTMQVRLKNSGVSGASGDGGASPVTHEVQILPREVAEHADSRHGLYEKAREGDQDSAAALKKANDEDWQAFQQRVSGSASQPASDGGGDAVRQPGEKFRQMTQSRKQPSALSPQPSALSKTLWRRRGAAVDRRRSGRDAGALRRLQGSDGDRQADTGDGGAGEADAGEGREREDLHGPGLGRPDRRNAGRH